MRHKYLLCAWVIFSCSAQAGPNPDAPVSLQLQCVTGTCRFRQGERMRLDLVFTSQVPKRYQLNLARYDRSGRMNYEEFVVTPENSSRDPLRAYFNSLGATMGGGLTNFAFLATKPQSIHLDLNEWVAFDRPGTYKLKVVSHRVTDGRGNEPPADNTVPVASNQIELQIAPADPAWQHAELDRIQHVLDGSKTDADNAARADALVALRFLDSEDAAREMARRIRGEDGVDSQCMFGLIGSSHREAGLDEMRKLFRDAAFPVTETFLHTMAVLMLDPGSSPEEMQRQLRQRLEQLRSQLVRDLSGKHGKVLAVSTSTALNSIDERVPAELRQSLVTKLIDSFETLPIDAQSIWLKYRWQLVKDSRWLPILRAVATRYEDSPELRVMPVYQANELSAAALKDWYELEPERARGAVLTEINRPKPRYGAAVLGMLPDETLPESERLLAEHLIAATNYEIEGNLGSLLNRYVGKGVLDTVLPKLDKQVGTWACEAQNNLLAYVLKVDPAAARPRIERAIAARGPNQTACRHSVLTDLGAAHPGPTLEGLAVSGLNDRDPEVALNAAMYLGHYGSPAAETALWRRYETWCRQWKGRDRELRFIPVERNPNVWEANLGLTLARSLGAGAGWLSDDAKLRRILDLAVGAALRKQAQQQLEAWQTRPFTISYTPFDPPTFQVAQYDMLTLEMLKTKLLQFPQGTEFQLPTAEKDASAGEEKSYREISAWASRNGMRLSRAVP